jgi:hypothetical protein
MNFGDCPLVKNVSFFPVLSKNRNVKLHIYGCTTLVNRDRFFSLLILYTVGRTP